MTYDKMFRLMEILIIIAEVLIVVGALAGIGYFAVSLFV